MEIPHAAPPAICEAEETKMSYRVTLSYPRNAIAAPDMVCTESLAEARQIAARHMAAARDDEGDGRAARIQEWDEKYPRMGEGFGAWIDA